MLSLWNVSNGWKTMRWTDDKNHIPLAQVLFNRKKGQAAEKWDLATGGWELPRHESLQAQRGRCSSENLKSWQLSREKQIDDVKLIECEEIKGVNYKEPG